MIPLRRAVVLIIILLLVCTPLIGIALIRAADDRPLLSAEQAQAFPLFEQTAHLVDPDYETHPFTGGNPGSPHDRVNDPWGYDYCDAWRDWILPGWSSFAAHDFEITNERQRTWIIERVRALWDQQEGELIIRNSDDARPVQLRNGEITYMLTFPENPNMPMVPDGYVGVSIGCLPVD